MPSGKPSHFKPSLLVTISKFDKNGALIKKYKYNYTEFYWKAKTKKSVFVKQVIDRRNTLLHPEDLYILIRKGIEMTEEKIENNE
jgi:predicted  nucleic acid-binding Zn-ribbon protein